MDLVDQQGQTVDVPDDKAQEAFMSGQYGVVAPKVDVRTPDGKLGSVASENLQKVLAAGYSLVPPAQATQERLQAKYGSPGGSAIAGAEGFLRGLTVGASDSIAKYGAGFIGAAQDVLSGNDLGESKRAQAYQGAVEQHIKGYQEANKGTAIGSEIIGAIAPIIATEGGALAARGAVEGGSLAARGAVTAGKLGIEGADLARAGAEGVELSRAAQVGSGAKSALSTLGAPTRAIAGAGDLAENFTAKAMQAALGERSTSGLGSLATKLVAQGSRGATEGALYGLGQNLNEQLLGDEELNGQKLLASGVYGGLLGAGIGAGLAGIGSGIGAATKFGSEKASSVLGGTGGKLREAAEVQAFRSMSLNLKEVKLLEKVPGGIEGAGRQFLEDGLIKAGDKTETMLPRFQEALETKGAALGEVRQKLEQVGLGPKLDEVTAKLSPLRKELEKLPNANKAARRTFDALQEDLVASMGEAPTYQQLADFKSTLGKSINWRAASGENAANDVKKAFYGALREHELEALTAPAAKKALGSEAVRDMQQTLLDYRRLTIATKGLEDRVAADARNRVISPSDYGVGIGAGAAMLSAGNPLGAVAGFASSIGHKIVRERGNATAAVVLDRIADMAGIAKRVDQFDRRIEAGIKTFVSSKQLRPVTSLGQHVASNDNYQAAVKRVTAAAADQQSHVTLAEHHLGDVQKTAPKITDAFTHAASVATKFLQSKVPPGSKFVENDLQPHLKESRVSDADQAKFLRYVRAVDDPASIVDDMAEGRLTPESVEALRSVYPKIYDQVRSAALSRIADEKHPIGYAQRVQMGILLGLPTDKTLTPEFVQSMQSTFGPPQKDAKPPAEASAPKRKLALADDVKLSGR